MLSPRLPLALTLVPLALLGATTGTALAQAPCAPDWTAGFQLPNPDGPVNAAIGWNDGTGPALFVGGDFATIDGRAARGVARYTESSGWNVLGGGLVGSPNIPPSAHAFAVHDDGSGPALYVGGEFTAVSGVPCLNVARWNGATWSPLGAGLHGMPYYDFVYALAVYDDGSGAKLYAAGRFTDSGGVPLEKIARWDGTSWSDVGGGLGGQPGDAVHALAVYDDGSGAGPMLYAGGSFSLAGGQPAPAIARWNGSTWSLAAAGANGTVRALRVFDDGTGPRLVAAGDFTALEVPASRIASFDGQHWTPVGNGTLGSVRALAAFDSGNGPVLYVGGASLGAPVGSTMFAKLVNGNFVGVVGGPLVGNGVGTLATFDLGSGPRLYLGGPFFSLSSASFRYGATYDGARFGSLGGNPGGVAGPSFPAALAFQTVHHGGSAGTRNYVGGRFDAVGGLAAKAVARLDDLHWTSIGDLTSAAPNFQPEVRAMAEFDFGNGPELVVGGDFAQAGGVAAIGVARFDGTTWAPVGEGLSGVDVFAVHDDGHGGGPTLYAGGLVRVIGAANQCFVARFDGAHWVPVGSVSTSVSALQGFDDGTGPQLYASFGNASALVDRIRRWDGTSWTSIGDGLASGEGITSFAIFDDGSGPRLYAAAYSGRVLSWNGTSWDGRFSVPNGATCLRVHDDGGGRQLYVGGSFQNAVGPTGDGVVRWDGANLTSLSGGTSEAYTLAVLEEATGTALYGGGYTTQAVNAQGSVVLSASIVRWDSPCPPSGVAFCSGDGSASACPCGNVGAIGRGCANSFDPNGAQLVPSGVPRVSDDSFALDAFGVSNSIVTFLQGSAEANGGQGFVFGDGLRCASGGVIRLGTALASNGTAHHPNVGQSPVSIRGAIPGVAYVTRVYQVWYRDSPAFCTPSTFSLTNGVRTFWVP